MTARIFSFTGTYRVQSRHETAPSTLTGVWHGYGRPELLDGDVVNDALRAHPQWQGTATVTLRPAVVTERSGKFASESDILYKRELFTPDPRSPSMPADIVDVSKARAQWAARARHVRAIFSDRTFAVLAHRLRDVDVVIANEYYVHDAGHLLGYDVRAKHADGYFQADGRTAWPLVYLEELRADLQGFGFAAALLPPARAVQILLYNLALRFGVHREGLVTTGVAPYGIVPFLTFSVLRELGALATTEAGGRAVFRLAPLDTTHLVRVMLACADHAQTWLTAPELATTNPLERALCAARYVRDRLSDGVAVEAYARVMDSSLRSSVSTDLTHSCS
jgi:hypothetical protein